MLSIGVLCDILAAGKVRGIGVFMYGLNIFLESESNELCDYHECERLRGRENGAWLGVDRGTISVAWGS
jgi:hypothetical protein